MKTITRMELKPGMTIAEDVSYQDEIIVKANSKADAAMINKLNRFGILCINVMEDVDFATTHFEKMRYDDKFRHFEKIYNNALLIFKKAFSQYIENNIKIPEELLMQIYNSLSAALPNNDAIFDYLYNMLPNEDALTYTQCLNSALLGGTIAGWMSMNSAAKETLILCGFYYDMGKIKLPQDILWKTSNLSDDEFALIKQHPTIGYNIATNMNLNQHVKNAILMHHERMDGTGYPYGLRSEMIDIYARYIAVIDTYCAMASPRTYRLAKTPFQIIDYFEKNIDKYDVEIIIPFMNKLANLQVGTRVKLNDDTEWEVMIINNTALSRPFLKNEKNEILNLMDEPKLEIVKYI